MSPTSQHVMAPARHVSNCHVTHIITHDGTGTPSIHFPSLITPSTQYFYVSSQFKYSRVIFQITLDESLIDISLYSLLDDLFFFPFHLPIFPLHLPIFPLHLVESKPPLSLSYINPATPRTHEVGKREAAFFSRTTPTPISTASRALTSVARVSPRVGHPSRSPIRSRPFVDKFMRVCLSARHARRQISNPNASAQCAFRLLC
jgi:hypothetical protein